MATNTNLYLATDSYSLLAPDNAIPADQVWVIEQKNGLQPFWGMVQGQAEPLPDPPVFRRCILHKFLQMITYIQRLKLFDTEIDCSVTVRLYDPVLYMKTTLQKNEDRVTFRPTADFLSSWLQYALTYMLDLVRDPEHPGPISPFGLTDLEESQLKRFLPDSNIAAYLQNYINFRSFGIYISVFVKDVYLSSSYRALRQAGEKALENDMPRIVFWLTQQEPPRLSKDMLEYKTKLCNYVANASDISSMIRPKLERSFALLPDKKIDPWLQPALLSIIFKDILCTHLNEYLFSELASPASVVQGDSGSSADDVKERDIARRKTQQLIPQGVPMAQMPIPQAGRSVPQEDPIMGIKQAIQAIDQRLQAQSPGLKNAVALDNAAVPDNKGNAEHTSGQAEAPHVLLPKGGAPPLTETQVAEPASLPSPEPLQPGEDKPLTPPKLQQPPILTPPPLRLPDEESAPPLLQPPPLTMPPTEPLAAPLPPPQKLEPPSSDPLDIAEDMEQRRKIAVSKYPTANLVPDQAAKDSSGSKKTPALQKKQQDQTHQDSSKGSETLRSLPLDRLGFSNVVPAAQKKGQASPSKKEDTFQLLSREDRRDFEERKHKNSRKDQIQALYDGVRKEGWEISPELGQIFRQIDVDEQESENVYVKVDDALRIWVEIPQEYPLKTRLPLIEVIYKQSKLPQKRINRVLSTFTRDAAYDLFLLVKGVANSITLSLS